MTRVNVADTATSDDECRDCGYEPELKRTLGPFQVIAISFAFISVAVGIYATCDDVLQNARPVGIWLWILAGGLYFAKMLIFNREVLDTEPGVDIFAAETEMTE
jgi:hypothetical protein